MSCTSKQAYWYALIEEWRLSGLTQKAFCQQRELSLPTFGYWVKKLRAQAGESASAESSAFMRLGAASSLFAATHQVEVHVGSVTLKLPMAVLSEALTQLKQGGWL